MSAEKPERMTDADKLRKLAEWFYIHDAKRGASGRDEVQQDLLRIATSLEAANQKLAVARESLNELRYSDDHDCMGPPHAERHCTYCQQNREIDEALSKIKEGA